MIPKIWTEQILEEMAREYGWRYFLSDNPLPPTPWHRKLRTRIRWFIRDDRERLALLLAPWLEPQDW